jgi:hypothetical protein
MPTALAPPKPATRRLLTSEEFLDWLQPGVFADLIGGEIVMHTPVNLRHARLLNFIDHHFYRRAGDMLGEFAAGAEVVGSSSLPGFWVKRAWLNPEKLPPVSQCLREILVPHTSAGRRRTAPK